MKQVYSLQSKFEKNAFHVKPPQDFLDLDEEKILKKEISFKKHLEFFYHSGKKQNDLISSTLGTMDLISKKVVSILEKNKFTGWDVTPVKILRKNCKEIEGYYLLHVTGKCGEIDDSKTKDVWLPTSYDPNKKFKARVGLYFDENSWDGSDFFSPKEKMFVFVTEKVKNALEKEGLSNIYFENIKEIKR